MIVDMLADIFRTFMMLLDKVVYTLVLWMYELFMMISSTGLFTQDTIRTFASRIYVLLGIFMLFKVSFSLVTYIVNPDTFSDKSKGISKLLTNFFVVLIGIIAVPFVFDAAFKLQAIILKDNIIGNIIMGLDSDVSSTESNNFIEEGGKNMSFTVFITFFRPNETINGKDCSYNPVIMGTDDGTYDKNDINSSCTDVIKNDDTSKVLDQMNDPVATVLAKAYATKDIYYLMDSGLLNARDENNNYVMDYTFLISLAAGGFLAWILLLFCIDIAIRSVKLGFLQLIAPIPVISYIDPDSGKNGMFKRWVTECTKTYGDLFMRLVAIYFALFIISQLTRGAIVNVVDSSDTTIPSNIFVVVFIIFGTLLFAKQLPKLLETLFKVNFAGGFSMNPMKRIGETPIIGGATNKALGLAGRTAKGLGALGLGAAGMGATALGGYAGKKIDDAAGNRFSSTGAAAKTAFNNRVQAIKNSALGQKVSAAGTAVSALGTKIGNSEFGQMAGSTFGDIGDDVLSTGASISAGATSALGIKTQAEKQDALMSKYDSTTKYRDAIDSIAEKGALKTPEVNQAQATLDALKSGSLTSLNGKTGAAAIFDAQDAYRKELKKQKAKIIDDDITAGATEIAAYASAINTNVASKSGAFADAKKVTDSATLEKVNDSVKVAKTQLTTSAEYARAHSAQPSKKK